MDKSFQLRSSDGKGKIHASKYFFNYPRSPRDSPANHSQLELWLFAYFIFKSKLKLNIIKSIFPASYISSHFPFAFL